MNSRSFGVLDPYIEELYGFGDSTVTDAICEITCINHHFFLSIMQNFSSDRFMEAFLYELPSVGIDYELMSGVSWGEVLQ